ncbi:MAG: aspartate aminotransferase family protein [Deltaproteobacteria bacterium]|nr:aspartate aminotransferase family protein [Deltaproteobacteria bacterium]
MSAGDVRTRDLAALLHPATNLALHEERGPLMIERGEGIHVYDNTGKEYIEGLAGLWCTALGYGVEELAETAAEQIRKLSFAHLFGSKTHEPAIQLAERLRQMVPIDNARVFFANSGSEANDSQVKFVWYYNNAIGRPEKKKIISRRRGYHGVTVASASLTGLPANQRDFDLPIANILFTDSPHHYRDAEPGESEEEFASRLAANLEKLIVDEGPDTVAAFIAEPVMGAGGIVVPPRSYFEKIQVVLNKYDILFIDDEVICGFGRTGNAFGAQTFDMRPDTMSLAKALSSAYLPISAVVIPDFMYQPMVESSRKIGIFGHGYTYSGHPVSAAVAVRTLELYEERQVFAHAAKVGEHFQARLAALGDHALVGESRGVGLIGGCEMVADKKTGRAFAEPGKVGAYCMNRCHEHGLIVRNIGDTVALCPPLIITESEISELFDRLERAIDDTLAWVDREALRG